MTIFNFERRALFDNISGRGPAPWEGTLPLTATTLVSALRRGKKTISIPEAVGLPAVFRSSNVLAGTIAGAAKSYTDDKGVALENLPAGMVDILHNPNPMIDDWIFWEVVVLSVLFHGNFYGVIRREGARGQGPIANITPLPPEEVTPKFVTKMRGKRPVITDKIYVWQPKNSEAVGIPADEIFHVSGLGFDGLKGCSVIEYGARTFLNSMHAEEYADGFFEQGAMMSGVLTTDKRLDKTAADALQSRWRAKIQGLKNAFDVIVLDSGTKFEPITIKPAEAQFVESRMFNVEDIGRLLGVPPELLGKAGERVLEPEKIAILFVKFSGDFWVGRIKSAVDRQLMPEDIRSKFNIQHMIQSDERTASAAAVMWRQAQIFSVNEIRRQQGEPPLADKDADDPMHIPENPAGAAGVGTNLGKPAHETPAGNDPGAKKQN